MPSRGVVKNQGALTASMASRDVISSYNTRHSSLLSTYNTLILTLQAPKKRVLHFIFPYGKYQKQNGYITKMAVPPGRTSYDLPFPMYKHC